MKQVIHLKSEYIVTSPCESLSWWLLLTEYYYSVIHYFGFQNTSLPWLNLVQNNYKWTKFNILWHELNSQIETWCFLFKLKLGILNPISWTNLLHKFWSFEKLNEGSHNEANRIASVAFISYVCWMMSN